MKRFFALMLSAAMCLSLAACGGKPAADTSTSGDTQTAESTQSGEKLKVGVCIYKFDDAFMTTYRNALQAQLEEKGYEVTVVYGNNDHTKHTEQLDTHVTRGVETKDISPVVADAADTISATAARSDSACVNVHR